MGWSSGKGLGAKEQGSVEHVRVRVKNDQVGELRRPYNAFKGDNKNFK